MDALMKMFWRLKKIFIYCGDKFGDFRQNVDDFFFETPGHTENDPQILISTKTFPICTDFSTGLNQQYFLIFNALAYRLWVFIADKSSIQFWAGDLELTIEVVGWLLVGVGHLAK